VVAASRAASGRVRTHDRRIKDWSHFSYFEVHDNVTKEEILELEALLLGIFSDDGRISSPISKAAHVSYRSCEN